MFCGVQGLMLHISLTKHNVYCTLAKAQIATRQDRDINIVVRKNAGYPVSFDRRINVIKYMQALLIYCTHDTLWLVDPDL
jgi:hypothetical protein